MFVFNDAQRAVVGIFLRDIYVEIGLGRKGGLILHATGWTPLGACQLCYIKSLKRHISKIRHWNMRGFKLVSTAPI